MKIIIIISVILSALTAAFCWVKGQPVDWDGFSRRKGGVGPSVMSHSGNILKKYED